MKSSLRKSKAAFTLVEIMLVVMLIGLLAALAIPCFIKVRKETRISSFENDLRQLSGAMERFALDQKHFPPDGLPGQAPPGFSNYLARLNWAETTSLGGYWDWDYNQLQFGCRAGISVYTPQWTDEQMREIDARIDDGNLSTGSFRKRSGGYIWAVEF